MNPTETPLELPGLPRDKPEALGRVKVAPTAARPVKSDSSHFYTAEGKPLYSVQKKDGSGERPFTLADARKMDPKPLPSVTTILKVLHKEALVNWLCEQTALAVLTTPRFEGESLDEFVYRCLHTERQQDQEGQIARDRGTQIHDAMERSFHAKTISDEIVPWVLPAFEAINNRRRTVPTTEVVVVGEGYAGKPDLIQGQDDCWWMWDWKSAKTLPTKGSWPEHRLQLAAYAAAWLFDSGTELRTGNVYISTVDKGRYMLCENPPWEPDYEAFKNLLAYWQWANNYRP